MSNIANVIICIFYIEFMCKVECLFLNSSYLLQSRLCCSCTRTRKLSNRERLFWSLQMCVSVHNIWTIRRTFIDQCGTADIFGRMTHILQQCMNQVPLPGKDSCKVFTWWMRKSAHVSVDSWVLSSCSDNEASRQDTWRYNWSACKEETSMWTL